MRPVAETFYDRGFDGGQTESALLGAIWFVDDSLSLDAGLRGARMGDRYAAEARLGLTWSISMGKHGGGEPAPRQGE